MLNSIKKIYQSKLFNMGGFPVRQAFPNNDIEQVGPFLLLHHANISVNPNIPVLQSGVGPHPHRGFASVTFIFEGGVHHRDSRGNNHVVYAGGIQWMNAGNGIIHSERPPANIHEIGGKQELIQLWVNVPKEHKRDTPTYFPLTAEETPTYLSEDGLAKIQVVAGNILGIEGKAPALSPLNALTIYLEENATTSFNIPANHHSFLYVLGGNITVNNTQVSSNELAVFSNDGTEINIKATAQTKILFCSGEPINEPIVAHGPFVMNTDTEILEAIKDYQMGKMGVLIEE